MMFRYKRLEVTFRGRVVESILLGPVKYNLTEPIDEELEAVNALRSKVWRLVEGLNTMNGLGCAHPDERVNVTLRNEDYQLPNKGGVRVDHLGSGYLENLRRVIQEVLNPIPSSGVERWFDKILDIFASAGETHLLP